MQNAKYMKLSLKALAFAYIQWTCNCTIATVIHWTYRRSPYNIPAKASVLTIFHPRPFFTVCMSHRVWINPYNKKRDCDLSYLLHILSVFSTSYSFLTLFLLLLQPSQTILPHVLHPSRPLNPASVMSAFLPPAQWQSGLVALMNSVINSLTHALS